MFQITSSLKGWQILFLIEGGATVVFAVIVYLSLPFSIDKAKFLNAREKTVATMRVLKDGSSSVNQAFSWRAFLAPLKDPRFYAFEAIGMSTDREGS